MLEHLHLQRLDLVQEIKWVKEYIGDENESVFKALAPLLWHPSKSSQIFSKQKILLEEEGESWEVRNKGGWSELIRARCWIKKYLNLRN